VEAGLRGKEEAQFYNHLAGSMKNDSGPGDDSTEALKQRLEQTRLCAHLKEKILAGLPPPEERERLYRELKEQGGVSFEQMIAELGLGVPPKP